MDRRSLHGQADANWVILHDLMSRDQFTGEFYSYNVHIHDLIVLQNKAVRIVHGVPPITNA